MTFDNTWTALGLLAGSEIFLLTFTIGIYVAALWLFRRTRIGLLHPLITSAAVIIVFLLATGISYEQYHRATALIDFLLGPSVVALGYALYRQMEHLRAHAVLILTSVVVGSVVGIVSVILIIRLFGAGAAIEASLVPKSVTTPIAMSISERAGGIGSLTAVVVILTGIFGSIVGPFVLRKLRISSRIAKGLALGSAAHGVGTARAMEMGAIEGAVSGLAIGLMGLVTALLVPVIERFL
ncbi:LrgB family protein [uncultured Rikenella sp.]|uniref:LrgB family protein n=1 Tax=uncultured Rikenella sp. TaxID=368003 RepID=UPI00261612DE|nr:LrgB family protein [uncultured Rikenella sp.]